MTDGPRIPPGYPDRVESLRVIGEVVPEDEVVERVARAIKKASGDSVDDHDVLNMAHAAIEAMRNPVKAGEDRNG